MNTLTSVTTTPASWTVEIRAVTVTWEEFSGRIVLSLQARSNRLRWIISSESPTHSHNLRKPHRDYPALPDRSAVEILIDSHSQLTLNLATQRLTSFELICLFFIEWTKRIVVCFRIFYSYGKFQRKLGNCNKINWIVVLRRLVDMLGNG